VALLLDTRTVRARDRQDALAAALDTTEVPIQVSVTGDPKAAHHRIDAWTLGEGMHVLRAVGTGFGLRRGSRQLRLSAPERVAVALQLGSPARWDSIAGLEAAAPGGLHLVDQTSAYDYRFNGKGGSVAVVFDYSRIGVAIDEARKAIPRLTNSPLYQVFREDLSNVCDALDDASHATVTDNLASGLQSLAKALVMTAAGGAELTSHASDESHEVLRRRILHFVHSHLGEHTLGEASLARRLNVSARSIRAAWPDAEPPLPEYLQRLRLERVRSELESRKSMAGSNGSIWRRWGFSNARALKTQFRQHFGMSVEEWGRSEFEALEEGTEDSPSRRRGE